LRDARSSHLKVIANGETVLYYDTHDSYEIDREALQQVDFYFKRSYLDTECEKLGAKGKVFPLGLNYLVYSDEADLFLLQRTALDRGTERLYNSIIALGLDCFTAHLYAPRVRRLEVEPDFQLPPRVLFMARAFEPSIAPSQEKREEREALNENRAKYIRILKREFGPRFLGGFMHDNYAKEKFKDCLLPDSGLSKKTRYMQLIREFPICIATTGLHGSIGWKLGEYASYSRAIVTEPLRYRLPGALDKEVNYLEFTSPQECVDAVSTLFRTPGLMYELMANNCRYYRQYVRPNSLVSNTLAMLRPKERLESCTIG
jgi:hypothetical protein